MYLKTALKVGTLALALAGVQIAKRMNHRHLRAYTAATDPDHLLGRQDRYEYR